MDELNPPPRPPSTKRFSPATRPLRLLLFTPRLIELTCFFAAVVVAVAAVPVIVDTPVVVAVCVYVPPATAAATATRWRCWWCRRPPFFLSFLSRLGRGRRKRHVPRGAAMAAAGAGSIRSRCGGWRRCPPHRNVERL